MDQIINAWGDAWQGYGISEYLLYLFLGVAAALAYRNWQRTLLVVWLAFYSWSMAVILSSDSLDMESGMTALWVCFYGLVGFILLGFMIYINLRE
jgi:hypothetical protein